MGDMPNYVTGPRSILIKAFKKNLGAAVLIAGVSAACSSHAQSAFDRSRNVGVLQRQHPGYEAEGIRVRSFVVRPELRTELAHDDNIYAAETGAIGDTIFSFRPEVAVESDWSRHSLSLKAWGERDIYDEQSQENTTQWQVQGGGRLDILRDANVVLSASTGKAIEARGSASYLLVTDSPIEYRTSNSSIVGSKEFNRVRVTGRLSYEALNYKDGVAGGTVVDEDFRDRDTTALTGRVDYALSPATALFLEVSGSKIDYDLTNAGASRDSDGERVLVGVNFEVTNLITGEIGVGHLARDYNDPGVESDNNSSYRAALNWYPTPLLTVNLSIDRIIQDSGLVDSISYVSDTQKLEFDYELRRNLVVVATVDRALDNYRDIARRDERYGGGLAANYLLNRNIGVSLSYTQLKQNSSGVDAGVDFTERRFGLALILQR